MIIWRGKGILIILYLIVTAIVLAIANRFLIETWGIMLIPFEVFGGLVLIVAGIWTKLTAEDYYIDKEGRKKDLGIANELFFIKMTVWGIILPVMGIGLIILGLVNAF